MLLQLETETISDKEAIYDEDKWNCVYKNTKWLLNCKLMSDLILDCHYNELWNLFFFHLQIYKYNNALFVG